ncbi:MAG TPA: hypothetical protein VKU80_03705 [Planctomycetota bacterium]|nr:hypothetical protein [Planctomycetota bacterium]
MKLLLIPALLLAATGPSAPVRFEADGIRVGSDLVTGAAVSLKEAGALPLLVSGSVVESLSGEILAVDLGEKQVQLGAGLRLARTADGYRLSTHGMPISLTAGDRSLTSDRAATFKITEKGFDFGALGTLEGASFAAKVLAPVAPAATLEVASQQDGVSPEKPARAGRIRLWRRVFSNGDPLEGANAASGVAVRMIPRVTPDGAP